MLGLLADPEAEEIAKVGVELKRLFFTKAKLARTRLNRLSQSGVISLCFRRETRSHR